MNTIKIYTDGSCLGNPGPGGYGVVILDGEERVELAQGYADTTNNRMELRAIIAGLKAIEQPSKIEILSDSAYALGGFKKNWIANWVRNGWKNASKKPVENRDLWEELIPLEAFHDVEWIKVKGHFGVVENERADGLAVGAASVPTEELLNDTGSTVISPVLVTIEVADSNQGKSLDKGEMIRLTGLSVLQAMKERAEEILAPELTGASVEDGFSDDGMYCLTCGFAEGDEKLGPDEHLSVVFNARVSWGGAEDSLNR